MTMNMTPLQAEALARFLLTIRPDWSKSFTVDAVSRMRLIDPELERIVRAAVRGALSPRIVKPDVLAMNGEHWRTEDREPARPIPTPRCEVCSTLHDADAPHATPASANPSVHIAALRQAAREARAARRLAAASEAEEATA